MKRTNKVFIVSRKIAEAMITASKDNEHRQVAKSRKTEEKEELYQLSSDKIGKGQVHPRSYWRAMKEVKRQAWASSLAIRRF